MICVRDLSQEMEVTQERNRLAAIAHESPSPMIELDRHGSLLYANPAMISLLSRFGYSLEGFPSVAPAHLLTIIQRCLSTGRTLDREDVILPNASFSWAFCPILSHGVVRGYATDMTTVYAAQQALEQTAAQLRESNQRLDQALEKATESARVKSAFLATVSHELRTPMNGVIGMTSLLMETPLTPEQRSYAETIRQCGESLLQLINDVLECSKIEAGKLELECLDFNLRTTVEQVLAQFAERAETKGIELTGLVHAAVPTELKGDPGRLRQVLSNLVANAVKFTDKGEVTLQAYLENESADTVDIRFEVTDTGIGMSARP
jgi:signal transduction histidine kinase